MKRDCDASNGVVIICVVVFFSNCDLAAATYRVQASATPGDCTVAAKPIGFKEYIDACQVALGEIPAFDCRYSTDMPVDADGHERLPSDFNRLVADNNDAYRSCDNPSWAFPQTSLSCHPMHRLIRTETNASTVWYGMCSYDWQQRALPTREERNQGNWRHFINVIGTNLLTGKTCFLQAKPTTQNVLPGLPNLTSGLNAGHSASTWEAYEDAWGIRLSNNEFDPSESLLNCVSCHNGSSVRANAFSRRTLTPDGRKMVDPLKADTPYDIVAIDRIIAGHLLEETFHSDENSVRVRLSVPARLIHPATKPCTQCHAIGRGIDTTNVLQHAFRTGSASSIRRGGAGWHLGRVGNFEGENARYLTAYNQVITCLSERDDDDICWQPLYDQQSLQAALLAEDNDDWDD